MPTATYTKAGTKATTPARLDSSVFSVEVKNTSLLSKPTLHTLLMDAII